MWAGRRLKILPVVQDKLTFWCNTRKQGAYSPSFPRNSLERIKYSFQPLPLNPRCAAGSSPPTAMATSGRGVPIPGQGRRVGRARLLLPNLTKQLLHFTLTQKWGWQLHFRREKNAAPWFRRCTFAFHILSCHIRLGAAGNVPALFY